MALNLGNTCLVLAFHGSRLPSAAEQAGKIALSLQQKQNSAIVRFGFLSSGQPSLADVLQSAGQEGFAHVQVWPLFLLPGAHTEHDIPELVERCASAFPGVNYRILPCLGKDAQFLCWLGERNHNSI